MLRDEDAVVRVLAPSEQRFVRHGTYTGRSVSVVGAVDSAAVQGAFAALQARYPVITCRIGEDEEGTGYLLRPGDSPVGATVSDGDVETIGLPVTPLDPGTQLAYLDVVVSGEDRWRLTLFAHHSVADAGHCVELLARFWDHYTGLVEGTPVAGAPHDYPRPLEWHVAQRGLVAGAVSGFEAVTRPLPLPAPIEAAGPADACGAGSVTIRPSGSAGAVPSSLARPLRTRLDAAVTARIVALGRHRGVSVNGLVTAALLRAFASGITDAATGPVPLGCLYPVDMRARLVPKVAPGDGTNMAGLASFAAEIDLSGSVLDLGGRIAQQLRADLAAGIVQQSVLHFPDFFGDKRIHSLAGHVAVTNTGAVPPFRTPAGLELTDYEIVYLSAHPRPSTGASAAVTFLVYTFHGALTIGLLGGGPEANRLLDAVLQELLALSSETILSEDR
ncbi:phthiocerol/phthiodiolone dimycocerosyl transferase family protein [Nocardia brasiliensis]|uniref:phthiocerol/phthiodiolone dimycocerosyl transferase family protein n=1 Tax=Nocardia brasiliensis TaxID=37326 RepID=UPI002B4B6F0F|nr:acyltransferase [Nocardia brasiliensis]